jgi:glycogen(starch) synthase
VRILLLAWEHPPRLHGGLGRHVHGLSRALAADGHEVHVVANGTTSSPSRSVDEGVQVHGAPALAGAGAGSWFDGVAAANESLTATALPLLAGTDFDVVHAHDWMVADATTAVLAAHPLPLVATIHATERGRHQGHLPGHLSARIDALERSLARAAEEIIVCSTAMAEQVADHLGVQPQRLTVVPNGVRSSEFAEMSPEAIATWRGRLTPEGMPLVVFAGRLEHEKGVHVLLRAVASLQSEERALHLAVAGTGTQEEELRRLAATGGLEAGSVVFTGFLDRPDLAALYAAADVVAAPSIYEPFGLVALEAMAAGTPVVAARAGGLAEVVEHRESGLLVPVGDEVALAAAIDEVLTDRRLAARLVDGGLRRAAASTWEEAARRTVAVYARAVEGRPRR